MRPAAAPIQIRQARQGELGVLLRFLMNREGTSTDEAAARKALQDLDPRRCVAWVAMSGERPVGLSTVLLRTIAAGSRTFLAGYWCALYVEPDFRQTMLYPVLPRAMYRALQAQGLDFVYASVRIPWLVEAHQRIGLKRLGEMAVMAKPLSPLALLVRRGGLPGPLEGAGRPVDGLVGAYRRLRWARALAGCSVEELQWGSPRAADAAALWARAADGRTGQPWTLELLRRRYGDAGGTCYSLLTVNERGRLVAAAVLRTLAREGLDVGVLMDVVAAGDGPAAARAIAAVEREAYRRRCQVVLAIEGPGVLPPGMLKKAGYLKTREEYVFLVWPCRDLGPGSAPLDFTRWRYAFGDHDAF